MQCGKMNVRDYLEAQKLAFLLDEERAREGLEEGHVSRAAVRASLHRVVGKPRGRPLSRGVVEEFYRGIVEDPRTGLLKQEYRVVVWQG